MKLKIVVLGIQGWLVEKMALRGSIRQGRLELIRLPLFQTHLLAKKVNSRFPDPSTNSRTWRPDPRWAVFLDDLSASSSRVISVKRQIVVLGIQGWRVEKMALRGSIRQGRLELIRLPLFQTHLLAKKVNSRFP